MISPIRIKLRWYEAAGILVAMGILWGVYAVEQLIAVVAGGDGKDEG